MTYPCWCYCCDRNNTTTFTPFSFRMRMNVCPDCGNKRCPRATDHNNACTGSNEPGQEGSLYAAISTEPLDVRVARLRAAILDNKES